MTSSLRFFQSFVFFFFIFCDVDYEGYSRPDSDSGLMSEYITFWL